jgi:protein-histidine pros-kinase
MYGKLNQTTQSQWIIVNDTPEFQSELLDLDRALDRLSGDTEFLNELFTLYLVDAPDRLSTLKTAMTEDDEEAMVKSAHSLKGISATVCASKMQELAYQAEMAARAGEKSTVGDLVPLLEKTLEKTTSDIREYLNG